MKKIVFLLFVIILCFSVVYKKKEIIIPNEAIRIRILANSNKVEDQKLKADIKNDVNKYLYTKLTNVSTYNEANNIIQNSIVDIQNIVEEYTNDYNISYSNNYFPEKDYKGVKYNEGYYPSLLITLGKGEGNNFWCVLFPPLCMIDEENNNREYKFLINELLKKVY